MSDHIEQLKDEISQLETETESPKTQQELIEQIADDDPELAQWGFVNGKRVENDDFDRMYNRLNPMTLDGAKQALAARRKRAKQIATVRNEGVPMTQRIAAATEIRNEGSFPHLKPEQIVEKLCA